MQNLPARASVRSPPRQATRATPDAPFRIIPGSAYCDQQNRLTSPSAFRPADWYTA